MCAKTAAEKKKTKETGDAGDARKFIADLRSRMIAEYQESGIGAVDKKEIAFLQALSTSCIATDGIRADVPGEFGVSGTVNVKDLGKKLDELTEAVSS